MSPVIEKINSHSPSEMEEKDSDSLRQCHICGKSVRRLPRHSKEVHKEAMDKSGRVKSARGYVVRSCPIRSKVVERMRDHIKRTHKINNKANLLSLMSQAYPITRDEGVPLFGTKVDFFKHFF